MMGVALGGVAALEVAPGAEWFPVTAEKMLQLPGGGFVPELEPGAELLPVIVLNMVHSYLSVAT